MPTSSMPDVKKSYIPNKATNDLFVRGQIYEPSKMLYLALPLQPTDRQTTECHLPYRAIEALITNLNWPRPAPSSPLAPRYEVRNTSVRGNGLFATTFIRRGDLILSEPAMFITSPKIWPAKSRPGLAPPKDKEEDLIRALADREEELKILFDRLDEKKQKSFMELANCHTEDGSGPIMGRIRTNGFYAEVGGEVLSCLCDLASRANHRYVEVHCYSARAERLWMRLRAAAIPMP